MSQTNVDGTASRASDTTPLPARSVLAIVGTTIRLFVTNLPLLLAIVVVPQVPAVAIQVIAHVAASMPLVWLGWLLMVVGSVVGYGALLAASIQLHLNHQKGFANSFRLMWPGIGPLLGLSILCAVVSLVGWALLLVLASTAVPDLAFYVIGFGVVVSIMLGPLVMIAGFGILVERLGVFAALRRAGSLCAGHYWRVLAGYVPLLLLGLVGWTVVLTFVSLAMGIEPSALNGLLASLPLSFAILVIAGFYIDIRGRKEGLTVAALQSRTAVFDPDAWRHPRSTAR